MKKGITFGAFDLFHAGHVLMLKEAKEVCDFLTVYIQIDPSLDRPEKNSPVQSIVEREIQISSCKYVDAVGIYKSEEDLLNILMKTEWDIRILGSEYKEELFTGRDLSEGKCYFNSRDHNFSSSELRKRISDLQYTAEKE
tara:strand:+ start:1455 stop:1874 length:420 start_codon:yes stop_codon:yes gene_type:complete